MLKRTALFALIVAAGLQACNKGGKQKTESGLEYQFIENKEGQEAKIGDFITLHITYRNHKDSVLGSTRVQGQPIVAKVNAPTYKASFEEALTMLSAGDSATFWISSDSLYKGAPAEQRPKFIPVGSYITFNVQVLEVQSVDQLKTGQDKKIKDYASKNKLGELKKTSKGVYYTTVTEGTGPQPQVGDSVYVEYTGKLLDGAVFDSSTGRGKFGFVLGQGQVIPGWEDGIAQLKQGGKATLLIPSDLAYGEYGAPPVIPPHSPLAFEVELVKVKTAASAPAKPNDKKKQ